MTKAFNFFGSVRGDPKVEHWVYRLSAAPGKKNVPSRK